MRISSFRGGGGVGRALERYYLTVGSQNPLRIQIPKGGYRPVFEIVPEPDIANAEELFLADEDPCAETLPIPGGPVIAVLPFRNLDGNADQDYFAAGFTGELTTALTRFDLLQVIAQQSTARYLGKRIDVRQVGRELGARFVLEGSIQRRDDRIRVTVALFDAEDGAQLWADTFDRDLSATDLFSLEDELPAILYESGSHSERIQLTITRTSSSCTSLWGIATVPYSPRLPVLILNASNSCAHLWFLRLAATSFQAGPTTFFSTAWHSRHR